MTTGDQLRTRLHRFRGALSLILALLLVNLQQDGLLHALSHFKPAHAQQEISSPQSDVQCVKCVILATGSVALPANPQSHFESFGALPAVFSVHADPVLAPPTSHRSRAPPFLS